MATRASRLQRALCAVVVMALAAGPAAEAQARGPGVSRPARSAFRAPRISAPRRGPKPAAVKPPRLPHAASPSRINRGRSHPKAGAAQLHGKPAQARRTTAQGAHRTASRGAAMPFGRSHYSYYGRGRGVRHYRAYGYGRGYRNRYYGSGYGYGRSQSYSRAIASRLMSVHSSLSRIDHDYQGHRVRAMHSVAMAVRQLTHRSMVYGGLGFAPGMGNVMAVRMGPRVAGAGAGAAAGKVQPMTQAQSDARMGQALRNLQGIGMQLSSQSHGTSSQRRALGHLATAVRELHTALAIR